MYSAFHTHVVSWVHVSSQRYKLVPHYCISLQYFVKGVYPNWDKRRPADNVDTFCYIALKNLKEYYITGISVRRETERRCHTQETRQPVRGEIKKTEHRKSHFFLNSLWLAVVICCELTLPAFSSSKHSRSLVKNIKCIMYFYDQRKGKILNTVCVHV